MSEKKVNERPLFLCKTHFEQCESEGVNFGANLLPEMTDDQSKCAFERKSQEHRSSIDDALFLKYKETGCPNCGMVELVIVRTKQYNLNVKTGGIDSKTVVETVVAVCPECRSQLNVKVPKRPPIPGQ